MLVRSFYIKDITNIAGPIILGNLGFILIGVGDVIVAGRHSTDTLAAVSLATAIINCIMIFGNGILGSISAILSNYRGAGKEAEKYFFAYKDKLLGKFEKKCAQYNFFTPDYSVESLKKLEKICKIFVQEKHGKRQYKQAKQILPMKIYMYY